MEAFIPLFQAVIAFVAVLTGLGFVFNLLLVPVKKDIAKLEEGQAKLEAGQAKLEAGQFKLESGLFKLESKLDQLLARSKA